MKNVRDYSIKTERLSLFNHSALDQRDEHNSKIYCYYKSFIAKKIYCLLQKKMAPKKPSKKKGKILPTAAEEEPVPVKPVKRKGKAAAAAGALPPDAGAPDAAASAPPPPDASIT